MMWRDVRCRGTWKGGRLGGHCTQLLCRVDAATVGALEIKCPRCKTVQTIKIETPAVRVSAGQNERTH
jgi:phage FluMu protein Com